MRKFALMLVGASLSLGFAHVPFPKPDRSQSELKKLQGEWVRLQNPAGQGPFPPTTDFRVVIADDRMKYSQDGTNVLYEYAMVLDARKKPAVLDTRGVAGMARGQTYRGVFRLEGDTLTLCSRVGEAEERRPVDFDNAAPGVLVEVFKRQRR